MKPGVFQEAVTLEVTVTSGEGRFTPGFPIPFMNHDMKGG